MELNLPRTIEWDDGKVRLINQLKLPHRLEYIETRNWRRVAEAIKVMEIRGAPAIGVAAAFSLALFVQELSTSDVRDALNKFEKAAEYVEKTRPTAVNLFWAVERIRKVAYGAETVDDLKQLVVDEALRIWREDEKTNRKIGEVGENLIPDGGTVITVCNAGSLATSYYGTVTAPIYTSYLKGKEVSVIAMETRPYLQGARLTAWELNKVGIPVKIITDNSIGIVVMKERVDVALVGADRITRKGYVANKIGTYPLALVCREQKVPFYTVAPTSTIDLSLENGNQIVIEKRDPEEVLRIFGRRIAPEGVSAIYYAFDITPPTLVNGIVTELGIIGKPFEYNITKLLS